MNIGLAVALLVALTACAPGEDEVVVFAAASLSGAFEDIEEAFEAAWPGTELTLSFGGSALLAAQIVAGAPASVFAAADQASMDAVLEAGRGGSPVSFATNRIVIVVPAGNPAGIVEAKDLASGDTRVVLAAPKVPAGAYARAFFADLGVAAAVERRVVSNETDVKEVLAKVLVGEADAGVVYATDITEAVADKVEVVELPGAPEAVYPAVVLAGGGTQGRAFVDFLLSPEGATIFERHGFGAP
jgi:molybdate transport system substrate-binding protein